MTEKAFLPKGGRIRRLLQIGLAAGILAAVLALASERVVALSPVKDVAASRSFLFSSCPRGAAFTGGETRPEQRLLPGDILFPGKDAAKREFLPGLAVALAVPLIDKGFEAIGAWLKANAEPTEAKTVWLTTGYAARKVAVQNVVGAEPSQCLVLIEGKFSAAGVAKSAKAPAKDEDLEKGDWSPSWLEAFGLAAEPSIYIEVAAEFSKAYTAWRLTPVWFEYRGSGISQNPSKARNLDLVFKIAFNGAAAGAVAMPLARDLAPGHFMTPTAFAGAWSGWVPVKVPVDKDGPSLARLAETPATIETHFVENLKPSRLNILLAELFAVTQAPLSEAIKTKVQQTSAGGETDDTTAQ